MNPWLRRLHYFAIGVSLAGMTLFVYAELWMFVGWSCFWGAYSTAALRMDRKGAAL